MFRNENGFSLIELMVVVAIIGILSAVAVPQFQKFQKKAKQAEAKMGLAAVYTAQKVFHIEHDTLVLVRKRICAITRPAALSYADL